LFAAFVALLGFGNPILVPLGIAAGIVAHLEGLAASMILREWTHDVPSVFHAWSMARQSLVNTARICSGPGARSEGDSCYEGWNAESRLSLPLAVLASVIASLLAVWALSKAAEFHFNPTVVAALSVAISAAVTSVSVRRAI
jgi:hypothetical protein